MTDWIPSQVGLRDHPKTRRLARALDDSVSHVVGYLHCLWYWTLAYAPDGDIDDFEPEDLADAAGWDGDPELFVNALLTCGGKRPGFLERDSGRLVVHDWEDNQGDSFRARIRAAAKKRAQRAERDQDSDSVSGDGDTVPKDGDTVPKDGDLARANDQTDQTYKNPMSDAEPSGGAKPVLAEAREVFDHWRDVMRHPDARFKTGSKREKAVRARLKDGYTVAQLKSAIDGCRASPHHMGRNETGTVYDELELICRDEIHVESFMAKARGRQASALSAIDEQWGES